MHFLYLSRESIYNIQRKNILNIEKFLLKNILFEKLFKSNIDLMYIKKKTLK